MEVMRLDVVLQNVVAHITRIVTMRLVNMVFLIHISVEHHVQIAALDSVVIICVVVIKFVLIMVHLIQKRVHAVVNHMQQVTLVKLWFATNQTQVYYF